MKLQELLRDVEYKLIQGNINISIRDIGYNSNDIRENDVYVALVGVFHDGHDYINEAIINGAKVIIVSKDINLSEDITVIKVQDTREVLAYISANYFHHPDKNLIKIGITGTKGKTSTAFLIKQILENDGKCGLISTNGIYIDNKYYETINTTPSSYLIYKYMREMVDNGIKYLVMEVSSHALKGHRVAGIEFDYGVFTNLSIEHVGPNSHPDYNDYADSKSLLFRNCKVGILNIDDKEYSRMIKSSTCNVISYGKSKKADYIIDKVNYLKDDSRMGMRFNINGMINKEYISNMPGDFTVYNMTAGIIVGLLLGISNELIENIVGNFKVRGRCEIYNSINNSKIVIDYAHNKSSMESIISTFSKYPHRHIVTIFGVGGGRSKERRIEMGEVSGRLSDISIITTDNPRNDSISEINNDIVKGINKYNGNYKIIDDREKAIIYALDNYQDNDIILLLGKGHEEYQEIGNKKIPLNEKDIIEKYIYYNKK